MSTHTKREESLQTWLEPFLARLPRPAQRRMCLLYVTGLIRPGTRKSMQPIASGLTPAVYNQLHHFISAGTWNEASLEAELLARADQLAGGPDAILIINEISVPKKGTRSVGVAPQYALALDKTINCQILILLTITRNAVSVPVALHLSLPETWTSELELLERAGVPADLRSRRSAFETAFVELDRIRAAGLRFGTVMADTQYAMSLAFFRALKERGLRWAASVPRGRRSIPAKAEHEPPCQTALRKAPSSSWGVDKLVDPPRGGATFIEGSRAPDWPHKATRERMLSNIVRRMHAREQKEAIDPSAMMLVSSCSGDFMFPIYSRNPDAVLKARINIVDACQANERLRRQLEEELGLGHFEGRSWRGLHRHTLMTLIASSFLQHHALQLKPNHSAKVDIIEVPISRMEEHERMAFLFAHLAYPEPEADMQRHEITAIICNMAILQTAADEPSSAYMHCLTKPAHLSIPHVRLPRIHKSFNRKMRSRQIAASMAIPFIQEVIKGVPFKSPEHHRRRLSLMLMAELCSREEGEKEPGNVYSRAWKPSIPVLHLALAMLFESNLLNPLDVNLSTLRLKARDPEAAKVIVDASNKYADIIECIPKLRAASSRILRFRLT